MARDAAWWRKFLRRYEGMRPDMRDLEAAVADLAAIQRERDEARHAAWEIGVERAEYKSRLAALTEAGRILLDLIDTARADGVLIAVPDNIRATLAGPAPKAGEEVTVLGMPVVTGAPEGEVGIVRPPEPGESGPQLAAKIVNTKEAAP